MVDGTRQSSQVPRFGKDKKVEGNLGIGVVRKLFANFAAVIAFFAVSGFSFNTEHRANLNSIRRRAPGDIQPTVP